MKRMEIVLEGKQTFLDAEDALDVALEKLMSCGATLSRLRRTAGLSKIVGQSAMTTLIASINKVGGGMEDLVVMHNQLSQVGAAMGYRPMLSGESDKPPVGGDSGQGGISNLHVVGQSEAAA